MAKRISATQAAMSPFMTFYADSAWAKRDPHDPATCDFVLGNPHEMPLPTFVSALRGGIEPKSADWFAYKVSEPASQSVIAESLQRRHGLPYRPEDVLMTNGAFAAIAVSLCALLDPGDEVVVVTPSWFFYEAMIVAYGGTPVTVRSDRKTHDLDLDAIEAAITERTKAIIVNSPNNPTGKIYPPETLKQLSTILHRARRRYGRVVYLISDEAYSRIVYDDREYPSPTTFYANTLLVYTYGKTLLTPGQRLGYIALPPQMPDREPLRDALTAAQFVVGFAFPNALLQHSLAELERVTVDVAHLQRKRDAMVEAFRTMGYRVNVPDGTFYLLVDAPVEDDASFCDRLAEHHVYVLPGSVVGLPGTFRVSLTANDDMIRRSMAGFRAAIDGVKERAA
ncbi:MAG: aminotransferase class I/II-fold pyridoxal phosphate-dependent enzyme [Trueperaceae bacterium]